MKNLRVLYCHLREAGTRWAYFKLLIHRYRKMLAFLLIVLVTMVNFYRVEQSFERLESIRQERILATQATDRLICAGQVRSLTNDLDNAILQEDLLRASARRARREGADTPESRRARELSLDRIDAIKQRATAQLTDLGVVIGTSGTVRPNGACEHLIGANRTRDPSG